MVGMRFQSRLEAPREFVWDMYLREGMFERLTPPWRNARTTHASGGVEPGGRRVIELGPGPVRVEWEALHQEFIAGRLFTDTQVRGPFAEWTHRHTFADGTNGGCIVCDEIEFRLPVAFLTHSVALGAVVREIRRMFRFRHFVTFHDVRQHLQWRDQPRRNVSVRGTPGDIVAQIRAYLSIGGHCHDETAPDAVAIRVSGASDGAIVAQIRDPRTTGAEPTLIRTAKLIEAASFADRLGQAIPCLKSNSPEAPGTGEEWTTIDDVAAAIHAAVISPTPLNGWYVRHPTTRTSSAEVNLRGLTVYERSRYRSRCEAIRTINGVI